MPWPFGRASAAERRRRAVMAYAQDAAAEPGDEDVEWLASVATAGDRDRARWELRYTRRSLAMLVAERDAHDDRTVSDVAREIRQALQLDRSVAAGMVRVAERQLNDRLSSYRVAYAMRTVSEPLEARLSRVLLGAGPRRDLGPDLARATRVIQAYLASSQETLRRVFGVASLPEDRPPSDLPAGRT